MKFENTKVGDLILVFEAVLVGFLDCRYFLVPKKVIKVTKTQITVEGGNRYTKDRGKLIGGNRDYAFYLGEVIGRVGGSREAKDESKEMQVFKERLKVQRALKSEIESLKIDVGAGWYNLTHIKQLTKAIKEFKSYYEIKPNK